MAELSATEIRDLIGALYQAVSAIVHQNEHPTSDGDQLDAALLDILADPDAQPLAATLETLSKVQAYYWAKSDPNTTTATPDARPAGVP